MIWVEVIGPAATTMQEAIDVLLFGSSFNSDLADRARVLLPNNYINGKQGQGEAQKLHKTWVSEKYALKFSAEKNNRCLPYLTIMTFLLFSS